MEFILILILIGIMFWSNKLLQKTNSKNRLYIVALCGIVLLIWVWFPGNGAKSVWRILISVLVFSSIYKNYRLYLKDVEQT